jgi:glycosyltransferase involved in cell wall biosynthesis
MHLFSSIRSQVVSETTPVDAIRSGRRYGLCQGVVGFEALTTKEKLHNYEHKAIISQDVVNFRTVIKMLIEDDVFDGYMHRLFASAEKYVIIYASNKISGQWVNHVKHRKFTDWIDRNAIGFNLLQFIPNKYPANGNEKNPNTSFAGFYVFWNKMAITSQSIFPKISLLVPVFNAEQYLHQCLGSVLGQSYENIEVICINDCSTDNSLGILNEYAKKDGRVAVIDKRINEGSAQARKTAFAYSSGEYILPIDSDDWLEPDMVELLYCCLEFGRYDIVCCGYFQEKDNGAYFDAPQILSEDKTKLIKYGIFGFGNAKVLWNKLVKRGIYEKVIFSEESNGEDCYISCQNLYHAKKVGYYPLPLYHYRCSDNSLSANKSIAQKRYEDRKANYERIIKFCIEKFGDNLSVFEPELRKRMANIEKQNPASRRNKLLAKLFKKR